MCSVSCILCVYSVHLLLIYYSLLFLKPVGFPYSLKNESVFLTEDVIEKKLALLVIPGLSIRTELSLFSVCEFCLN